MTEISVRIGGQKYRLAKSSQKFSVLTKNRTAIKNLLKRKGVKAIEQVAPGVQLVTSTNSKTRDTLMEGVRKTGVSHHVYEIIDKELKERFIITDKINIKFRGTISKEKREDLLRNYNLQFEKELAPNLYRCQITNETKMNPLKLCSILDTIDEVEYAEPDFVMQNKLFSSKASDTIQDQLFKDEWHLNDEVDIPFVRKGSDIKVSGAWKITKGNADIIIAIMDDGFDLTNPDLKHKIKFPADFTRTDTVSGDPTTIVPDDDLPLAEKIGGRRDYHGTPCAGLALASEGYGQIVGVAPGCSFMPVRWNIDGSTQSLILDIFKYISLRADIVSCSWGSIATPLGGLSSTIHDTINELSITGGRRGLGLIVCFAAGNQDLPTFLSAQDNKDGQVYYGPGLRGINFRNREIHSGWTEIDSVIVVASYTSMNRKALYSNWGIHITIAAPSDNWHPMGLYTRKKYHSVNLVTTDNELHGLGLFERGLAEHEEGYVTHGMGGTSGATPIVAGVCGLVLSANPNLTAKQVEQILIQTANKSDIDFTLDDEIRNNKGQDGNFVGDNQHSLWFGYGKVNSEAAVARAKQLMASP
jgi:subtilisin family serine protease